jgi:hypothetical protein
MASWDVHPAAPRRQYPSDPGHRPAGGSAVLPRSRTGTSGQKRSSTSVALMSAERTLRRHREKTRFDGVESLCAYSETGILESRLVQARGHKVQYLPASSDAADCTRHAAPCSEDKARRGAALRSDLRFLNGRSVGMSGCVVAYCGYVRTRSRRVVERVSMGSTPSIRRLAADPAKHPGEMRLV